MFLKIFSFIIILYSTLFLYGCDGSGNQSIQPNPKQPSAKVDKITVGKMAGDTDASAFSVEMSLNIGEADINQWWFGFYSPRSFMVNKDSDINPNLIMKICETNSTVCSTLDYLKAKEKTDKDLGVGYTTMLVPNSTFTLKANTKYTISLLHSNQWNLNNYSSVPQSLFLIVNDKVINLPVTNNNYTFLDYDSVAIESDINTHIQDNWDYSNTNQSTSIVVPAVLQYGPTAGDPYEFKSGLKIHNTLQVSGAFDDTVANFFSSYLKQDLNIDATVDNDSTATTDIIIKEITDATVIDNNPEGYTIEVLPSSITIEASTNTGVFYALQTLRQLWNVTNLVNNGSFVDYPRFKYRGLLLDVSRHFFTVADIKSLIDVASGVKLNTLHIHFADDEGTRVALDSLKSNIAVADTRGYGNSINGLLFIESSLDITNYLDSLYPAVNTNYVGTYSKQDLADIIGYANARSMTIIPEIDSPGHAHALIKAFPNILLDPNDLSSYITEQGYTNSNLPVCTYNSGTSFGNAFKTFYDSMFTELATVFNNQTTIYAVDQEVSIGGHEVSANSWTSDSSCNGTDWKDLNALAKEHYFFNLFSTANPNLKISGWQEYIQNTDGSMGSQIVPATNSGHVWFWGSSSQQTAVKNLAESGYDLVLAFSDELYFDLTYSPNIQEPGFYWAGSFLDTHAALYSAVTASTSIANITTENQKHIVGLEGTLWGENMATFPHLMYMATPKITGLAEAAWSPEAMTVEGNQTDWQDLTKRLGKGQDGYLNYMNKVYNKGNQFKYRGYPNGISAELPTV